MPLPNPRRSALFLPASNAKAIAKARTLPADMVILDLEDAVAPDNKPEAREAAVAAVREGGFGARELIVRINALATEWGVEDLRAVSAAEPAGILIPKVSAAKELHDVRALMGTATPLWAMIETCAALPRLDEIAATPGLAGFVLGTNDLAREMRAQLLPGRAPFVPIMTLAVAAARAHGIAVLDGVCNDFADPDRLRAECVQGREFGFDGKTLIHPAQIDICNAVFSPSAEEAAWAEAVIAAFDAPENQGKGAVKVDGRMVERLHLDEALRIRAAASVA
jgi:citrate lyase subunit beta/citryl-CoA lyase